MRQDRTHNLSDLRNSPPRASFVFGRAVHTLWLDFIDLLYPPVCVHCRRVGELICKHCLATIEWQVPDTCPVATIDQFLALGPHTGVLRSAIHALKYENERRVAGLLGQWMGAMILDHNVTYNYVLPVPLHSQRLAERGYNQSNDLATAIIEVAGGDLINDALIRNRYTHSQVELSAIARQQNVAGAFEIRATSASRFIDQAVLIIDDVCTTGSTLAACAKALYDVGASRVHAATVCYATGHR